MIKNFLPEQYLRTGMMQINHNYLRRQFADFEKIFEKLKQVVSKGDFTLGEPVDPNVWGDGGIIVTDSDELADRLRLMRNHGLQSRDECLIFSYNSRLDTMQAVAASHMLEKLKGITEGRIKNAAFYDQQLATVEGVQVPRREDKIKQVFHLYSIQCDNRDQLQAFLIEKGVDAKIHYPVPMHLQPAARHLGYMIGDFPICERIAKHTLSLPVHDFLTENDLEYVVARIKEFYDQS